MKKNVIIFLLFALSISCISNAQQDSLKWSVGLFFHYNYIQHSADFKKLPNCPSCSPGYEEGSGTAPAFGLLFEYTLSQSFVLGLRANYFGYGGELTKNEPIPVIVNGVRQIGELEHSITATLNSIGLEPLMKYRTDFGLDASAGFHIGSVNKSTYVQYEKVVTPSDKGTFTDGKRIRNESSGDIPSANSINLAFFAGLSYELPLNHSKTLILEPEVRFTLGLLPIVDAPEVTKWGYMAFGGGLAIKYSPNFDDFKNFFDIFPTSQPKEETIVCSIYAVAVDSLDKEYPNPKFKIEEFLSNRVEPLLPYIFFEDNSAVIQNKYKMITKESTKLFSMNDLYDNTTLETYYEIMNIVGYRMTLHPKAKLTITGCNSDLGAEDGNKTLSMQRAEKVKEYLVNIWQIDTKRLTTVSRNLPSSPSLPKTEDDKIPENRRVEFTSDTYEITEPVFLYDTLRTASPPIARFYPTANASAGVSQWNITAKRFGGLGIINFDSTNQGDLNKMVDWDIAENQRKVPKGNEDLEYVLNVTDSKGNISKTEKQILPIEYISVEYKRREIKDDKEYHKFSLILFDFDDFKISGNNQKIVNHIKTVIKPESEVTISGYTDRTGDDNHNAELSLKRADNAKKAINNSKSQANGFGESKLLYDNNIPEGRFYCRTVEINVVTPIFGK